MGTRVIIPEAEWAEGIMRECPDERLPYLLRALLQVEMGNERYIINGTDRTILFGIERMQDIGPHERLAAPAAGALNDLHAAKEQQIVKESSTKEREALIELIVKKIMGTPAGEAVISNDDGTPMFTIRAAGPPIPLEDLLITEEAPADITLGTPRPLPGHGK